MADLIYTGTQVNYYFVCERKLWLFSKDIRFENENENVQLGRLIDETSYKRAKKQIEIGNIKIDFIDNRGIIHEIKKSNKIEKAHIYQVKYYLLTLKRLGVDQISGEIDYPRLKKRETVILEKGDRAEFDVIFNDIDKILDQPVPPAVSKMKICSKCAYYEFCFV